MRNIKDLKPGTLFVFVDPRPADKFIRGTLCRRGDFEGCGLVGYFPDRRRAQRYADPERPVYADGDREFYDTLVRAQTAFDTMAAMMNAGEGRYFPSLYTFRLPCKIIADEYDKRQSLVGDPRRAFRTEK